MKELIAAGVALLAVLGLAACGAGGGTTTVTTSRPSDSQQISNILSALRAKYPLPYLTDSSDLRNQIEYAKVQSDPNKIEYLEFLSLSGTPIGSFTIKGQVSAESTRVTSPIKDACYYDDSGQSGAISCVQDPQPDLTGTFFSQSGGGYFAYLTDGALIQWPASVQFITSDQPFKTSAPVQLNVNENAPISATQPHVQYTK
jgi:hypothetical protein